jgi:hypothetical protein
MNRFVSHKSALFLVVAWVVALTLFADGANLDDLASGTVVLHDDDQVTQSQVPDLAASMDRWSSDQSNPHSQVPVKSGQPLRFPASPVRVIVDQDSPSLAAEWRLGTIFESLGTAEFLISVRRTPPAHNTLYLQYCTLLL